MGLNFESLLQVFLVREMGVNLIGPEMVDITFLVGLYVHQLTI